MTDQNLRHAGFTGRILNPETPGFADASKRYSGITEHKARFIALPLSSKDVSIAIKFAQEAKIPLAVRGGGNHPSNASSVEDGLVIDMSSMRQVVMDNTSSCVIADGGCRWADVYGELLEHNRICVGGGVHIVGIGGHLTGGGWGPLTKTHGLACDNVLSATVVVADGRILAVNEVENSDLFWAIRGGSSQFGVVTQLVLRTFPHPEGFVSRTMTFPEKELSKVALAVREFINRNSGAADSIFPFLFFVRSPDSKNTPSVIVEVFGLTEYSHFDDLINQYFPVADAIRDETRVYPNIVDLSHALDDVLLADGPRRIIAGAPLVTNLWQGMAEEVWQKWLEYTNSNPDVTSTMVAFEMHTTVRRNPGSGCFPVQEPTHNTVVITEQHNEPTNDARAADWVRDVATTVQRYQSRNGKSLPFAANGTSFPTQPEEVWGESYPRLRKVKAKYDPQLTFNRFHPIQPDFSTETGL